MALEEQIERIASALEGIESDQGDHRSVTIDFDVETYNLIAFLGEELSDIAKSLRIMSGREEK